MNIIDFNWFRIAISEAWITGNSSDCDWIGCLIELRWNELDSAVVLNIWKWDLCRGGKGKKMRFIYQRRRDGQWTGPPVVFFHLIKKAEEFIKLIQLKTQPENSNLLIENSTGNRPSLAAFQFNSIEINQIFRMVNFELQ